jgi:hypothetical protein
LRSVCERFIECIIEYFRIQGRSKNFKGVNFWNRDFFNQDRGSDRRELDITRSQSRNGVQKSCSRFQDEALLQKQTSFLYKN